MKLICHIGTPKTASTLIQNSFEANPDWLAERGIAYGRVLAPDANHITLFYACANTVHDFARDYGLHSMEDLKRFRDQVDERIAWHKSQLPDHVDTMVFSSENLTGNMRHINEIKRLKELLSRHFDDIKIVVYVRRQDDAILSMYGEFMRRGFGNELFRDFVDTCLGPDSPTPYLYYRRELSRWIEVWGRENIIVRRFSPVDFIDGDILSDFMGVVLNTWEPDMDGFVASKADNRGLSAPMLELLRRLHPHIPFITKDGKPNPQRTLLTPIISTMPTKPRPVMAAGTARHIMRHFGAANGWLKETFFPDLEGPFFPERPDHPEHGNLGQVTPEEMVDLTGELLSKILVVPQS
ncbi:hypothetical protein AVJ23_20075 [Pseudoponticoccus marisrubri]|uniref:Sulfotransferase domain-containing protein n=1 Tax=Pseudoponticoccus marisrubri TaxID=1685382 RepID=A0A0W7WEJ7_9RHOB|nr:hypothetical protein AVJ23_20075 [Pseudoponticoccus marisrubri]